MASDFWTTKHVVVTGGAGFLGRVIVTKLHERGVRAITVPRSATCDLRREDHLQTMFDSVLATADAADVVVIHAAAHGGGIGANVRQPATFFYDNLLMGTRLLHEACSRGVGKFVSIGTVCAYPKYAPIPFREDDLWNGYPEETNAAYGLAKKMLLVQGQAYRAQFGFNAIYLLPTNLYGPGDNFDLETSHVVPAIIRKCMEARRDQRSVVVVWGTGHATRDYLFVDDAAEGILLAAEHYDGAEPVNLSGNAGEISMRELVALIGRLTDYAGEIVWDTTKPDGQPRRTVDGRRARELFDFRPQVDFEDGLRRTIDWFDQHN
ncbi:MAG: GDP-L-fucose synthase [Chloroflexi bacterium]|nr:GDP-L-fucose synthase [Chloroflexota bacterium]